MERMTLYAPITCYIYLTIFLYGASALGCNDNDSVLVDEMCIFYDPTRSNWFEAKKTCAKHGMHLATVQSPEQILRMISILPPKTRLDAWVGGNDQANEGVFIWDEDHRPIVENVWRPTEPNHDSGDEDCTFVNDARLINDVKCSDNKPALCMYRLPTPMNFFGPSNTYICHCVGGTCLSDGTCSGANVQCSKGWFGPSCQFRSLSGDKYGPLGVLADNDDTTCKPNISQPIKVKLRAGSFFTWIRIIVQKPEHLGGFELYFNTFGVKVVCQGMRVLAVDEISVDISCVEGPFVVDDVLLSWSGEKSICSLYINGDQNFALLEGTSLGDDVGPDNSSSLAVDGRRSPADECFTGLPKVGRQVWTLKFKRPKVVNEIVIYRRPRVDSYSFMNKFHIKSFDGNGVLMFHYNDTGANADRSTVWFITDVSVPMNMIEIVMDAADEKHYLELCEVETFGACGSPDYGLFCDKTCDVTCRGQVCHYTGRCIACSYGQSVDGECLTAQEAVPTVPIAAPEVASNPTNAPETRPGEGTTATTAMAVTAAPLALCTTPLSRAAENNRLVKYLVLGNLLLALTVVLLIIYIIYTRKESGPSTAGSPAQESDKMAEDVAFLEDLKPVKSEPSPQSEASLARGLGKERSQVTLKLSRSASTNII